jgi:hypothetical protein
VAAGSSLLDVPLVLLALSSPLATWLVLSLLFYAYLFSEGWIGPSVHMAGTSGGFRVPAALVGDEKRALFSLRCNENRAWTFVKKPSYDH